MKKKDFTALRAKKTGDLEKLVVQKRLDIVKIKAALASGQEKNLKKAKNLKRELAKVLTLIKEKEIIEKVELSQKPSETERKKKK